MAATTSPAAQLSAEIASAPPCRTKAESFDRQRVCSNKRQAGEQAKTALNERAHTSAAQSPEASALAHGADASAKCQARQSFSSASGSVDPSHLTGLESQQCEVKRQDHAATLQSGAAQFAASAAAWHIDNSREPSPLGIKSGRQNLGDGDATTAGIVLSSAAADREELDPLQPNAARDDKSDGSCSGAEPASAVLEATGEIAAWSTVQQNTNTASPSAKPQHSEKGTQSCDYGDTDDRAVDGAATALRAAKQAGVASMVPPHSTEQVTLANVAPQLQQAETAGVDQVAPLALAQTDVMAQVLGFCASILVGDSAPLEMRDTAQLASAGLIAGVPPPVPASTKAGLSSQACPSSRKEAGEAQNDTTGKAIEDDVDDVLGKLGIYSATMIASQQQIGGASSGEIRKHFLPASSREAITDDTVRAGGSAASSWQTAAAGETTSNAQDSTAQCDDQQESGATSEVVVVSSAAETFEGAPSGDGTVPGTGEVRSCLHKNYGCS